MKNIVVGGLYRSGSTWLFNLLRMMAKRNEINFESEYNDDYTHSKLDKRITIIKSHNPSSNFIHEIKEHDFLYFCLYRNPLDVISSMILQFSMPFNVAESLVKKSCDNIILNKNYIDMHFLRYEDCVIGNIDTIKTINQMLGGCLDEQFLYKLHAELSKSSVAKLVENIEDFTIFEEDGFMSMHEKSTLWHPNHIGDGRVAKYKNLLSEEEIAICINNNRAFFETFYSQ